MPKRTLLSLVLFLIGCPKEPAAEPDAALASTEVFQLDPSLPPPSRKIALSAPIEVLAPQGRRIELHSLRATVSIAAPTASTELSFRLAEPTPPGARLSLRLPRNAAIHRAAARVNGAWIEATHSPNERSEGAEIPVQEVEHRFKPVLPPETLEVTVAYGAVVPPHRSVYRLELAGLPELETLEASITVAGSTVAAHEARQRWKPDRDLAVSIPAREPAHPQGKLQPIDSLIVLIDSSASSVLDWRERAELARTLVEALGRGSGAQTMVHVAVFDQVYHRFYEGTIGELPPEAWQQLVDHRAFGGSSYSMVLAQLAATGRMVLSRHRFSRALFIGDGMANVGPSDPEALAPMAKRIEASLGVKRFDAIAFGHARNEVLLRALAKAGATPGNVIDADLPIQEIARRLSLEAGPEELISVAAAPAFYAEGASQLAKPRAKKPKLGVRPPQGTFAEIMTALGSQRNEEALQRALAWHSSEPLSPIPFLLLGEIYSAMNDERRAARAFGSLVDLFPARPEIRTLVASRLELLSDEQALKVALESYDRALALAPDRAATYRLFVYALLRARQEAYAFTMVERALKTLPVGPVQRILREDAGLVAAAWIRKEPDKRAEITSRLIPFGMTVENQPSLSFSLYWDAEVDVDLAVEGRGARLPLSSEDSASFGPEVAIVRGGAKQRAYPYQATARAFGLGPLGVTAGKLAIVEHDGAGVLWFAGRSFMLTTESGVADLGGVARPFGKPRPGP